jgi:DNA-binding MarR family transcriptional regulator
MNDQSEKYETDCLCIHLRRIARSVTQAYDDALAASGIKLTQFSLLRSVERNEPAAIGTLAEELELDRTTLARNLRPLERDGLLTTSAAAADQRVTEVRLTARGRRAIAQALPAWQAMQAEMNQRIGARHTELLRELAFELPAALQTPPPPIRKVARAR